MISSKANTTDTKTTLANDAKMLNLTAAFLLLLICLSEHMEDSLNGKNMKLFLVCFETSHIVISQSYSGFPGVEFF